MWFFSWHTLLLTWKLLLAIHPFLWRNCWGQKKFPSTRCQLLFLAVFFLLFLLPGQQSPPSSNKAAVRQQLGGLCAQSEQAIGNTGLVSKYNAFFPFQKYRFRLNGVWSLLTWEVFLSALRAIHTINNHDYLYNQGLSLRYNPRI